MKKNIHRSLVKAALVKAALVKTVLVKTVLGKCVLAKTGVDARPCPTCPPRPLSPNP